MRCLYGAVALLVLASFSGCAHSPRAYVSESVRKSAAGGKLTRVAIMPFENLSGQQEAGKKVESLFLVALLSTRRYAVAEPGEVDRIVVEERIRSSTRMPLSVIKTLGEKLDVEVILLGTVLEYRSYGSPGGELPSVALAARMVDTRTGAIVWSSNHSRKGDDSEIVFGLGRVTSLETLAQSTVRDMVKTIAR